MKETAQTEDDGGFGLDKDARLQAGRQRDAEENRPDPLDPPFPFRVIGFDPIMATRSGT